MSRPLSPALLMTFALALVDDAAAVDASAADAAASEAPNVVNDAWSVAFVHHVGYWSHFDYRMCTSVWPLPLTASCDELASFAARHFVLAADAPEAGDIYLLWSPAKRVFVRAGIVLNRSRRLRYPNGRRYFDCLTVDGDTTREGFVRGGRTAVVQRVLSPSNGDRLIRWPSIELTSVERALSVETPLGRAA